MQKRDKVVPVRAHLLILVNNPAATFNKKKITIINELPYLKENKALLCFSRFLKNYSEMMSVLKDLPSGQPIKTENKVNTYVTSSNQV